MKGCKNEGEKEEDKTRGLMEGLGGKRIREKGKEGKKRQNRKGQKKKKEKAEHNVDKTKAGKVRRLCKMLSFMFMFMQMRVRLRGSSIEKKTKSEYDRHKGGGERQKHEEC